MSEWSKLPPEKKYKANAILGIIFGLLMAIPGIWLTFFKFQLHSHPELIMKSAKGFGLMIALAITGVGTLAWGLYYAFKVNIRKKTIRGFCVCRRYYFL